MNEQTPDMNPFLLQLIYSLQAASMQQMGKVMNPMTNKIERNLALAQNSIDMLAMVEEKTKGNLSEEEMKLLSHVLYELRLNFLDESKKKDTGEVEKEKDEHIEKNDNPEKE